MKYFDKRCREKIGNIIAELESVSMAEIVVMAKPASETYFDIILIGGNIFAFVAFTYFFFSPTVFSDLLIYSETILAMGLGSFVTAKAKPMIRLLSGKKRQARSVEIMARALFQKAGINQTRKESGLLILISLLEKQVFLLPDRGLEQALSENEWQKIKETFQKIFKDKNPETAFLRTLAGMKEILEAKMPAEAVNINELPDNLEVDL